MNLKNFYSKNIYFFFILILSLTILICSTFRSIETNGDNADDKLTHYIYSINFLKKNSEKVSKIEELSLNSCKTSYCKNRVIMQIDNNNNYPILSKFINFFDNFLEKETDDFINISKSFHFSVFYSLILLVLLFNIFVYLQPINIQKDILIFIFIIILIDKYFFNIELHLLIPKFKNFNVYPTEYVPRGYALFCGIISFLFIYYKKYLKSFLFLIFAILNHVAFGASLLILILFFFIFLFTKKKFKDENRLINLHLLILLLLIFLFQLYSCLILFFLVYFLMKKKVFNSYQKNLILYLLTCSIILLGVALIADIFDFLIHQDKYNYISNLFNTFFLYFGLVFPKYENILSISNSYFFYIIKHISSRIYPLTSLSLLLILLVGIKNYITNFFKFFEKNSFSIFIFFFIFLSPLFTERFFYLNKLYKNYQNELLTGIKKEGSYNLYRENIKIKVPDLQNMDFVKREVYSLYQVLKFYKNY
jgi:hypothetical protein